MKNTKTITKHKKFTPCPVYHNNKYLIGDCWVSCSQDCRTPNFHRFERVHYPKSLEQKTAATIRHHSWGWQTHTTSAGQSTPERWAASLKCCWGPRWRVPGMRSQPLPGGRTAAWQRVPGGCSGHPPRCLPSSSVVGPGLPPWPGWPQPVGPAKAPSPQQPQSEARRWPGWTRPFGRP